MATEAQFILGLNSRQRKYLTQGQHTSFIYQSIAWQNNVCIFNGQTLVSNLLKSAVQFVLRGIAGYLGAN